MPPSEPVIPNRLPSLVEQDTEALIPQGSPDEVEPCDAHGQPVHYHQKALIGPDGHRIPILERVDSTMLISTKFRECAGRHAWCAQRCTLTHEAQDWFQGKPCPLEVNRAWTTLYSLAGEFQTKLVDEFGEAPDRDTLIEQAVELDQIGEYLFWDLMALRVHMALAREDMVLHILVPVRGEAVAQPMINPHIDIAERVTNLKTRLWDKFMTHARARFERLLKATERVNDMDQMFIEAQRRAQQQQLVQAEVIDGELSEEDR